MMADNLETRISELLVKKGIKQKELADKAGVTQAAMSHYINGTRIPRASTLKKIAEALNTTTEYLLDGKAAGSDREIEYATKLIARNVQQMSHEEKMRIVDILMKDG